MDIMCHDSSSGYKWIYYGANNGFSDITYCKPTSWCSHSGASLYIGDFNGDSRDDNDGNGHVFIAYTDKFGHFIIEERRIEAALELFCVISVSARHLVASK